MKRYFLLACLGGLLAAPTGWAQPTIDLGPNIVATEGNTPAAPAPEGFATPQSSPGLVSRVSHWFGPRCEPAPACATNNLCVGPGACATGGCQSRGECMDRIKTWLCYRSDHGKLLPCFEPTKYRPPLYNWFPCYEGCATGCGPHGCGGPPITYYYPTKQHPAPLSPKLELRGPQGQPTMASAAPVNASATKPAATPASLIPGMRFASAETPGVSEKKRSPGILPATTGAPSSFATAAPLAARPEASDVSWQTSFKNSPSQR